MAQRIAKADFEARVLHADKPVLIDFYSDSCVPCKQLSPILGDIEDEYEGKLDVYKVNVNFDTDLAQEYGVMSSPTLILFKEGNRLDTKRGLVKKPELTEWIEKYI